MEKFAKEFREFAVKGNVIDLAIAVIIGGAFGKIVSSLVADIIMPPIGVLMGGLKFTDIKIKLSETATLNIGNFLQNTVDFLIIALVIFLMIKLMSKLKKQEVKEEAAAPVVLTKDQALLQEIRDLLKEKK